MAINADCRRVQASLRSSRPRPFRPSSIPSSPAGAPRPSRRHPSLAMAPPTGASPASGHSSAGSCSPAPVPASSTPSSSSSEHELHRLPPPPCSVHRLLRQIRRGPAFPASSPSPGRRAAPPETSSAVALRVLSLLVYVRRRRARSPRFRPPPRPWATSTEPAFWRDPSPASATTPEAAPPQRASSRASPQLSTPAALSSSAATPRPAKAPRQAAGGVAC
ncbi:vegetative cell wall protein gp1-like [Triticum dicoccoides]|uniref:vegetative cell wall protein gp1-like n=1 Tax=Triticum dicoccoides TaxID=85692 RepID=UPI001890D5F7|nr:vegetative cell wall protein gp1-like [Triticum dicoccoides]XP_044404958.1 vegetative cell wall protein gp1-like [Triticum aestivum]